MNTELSFSPVGPKAPSNSSACAACGTFKSFLCSFLSPKTANFCLLSVCVVHFNVNILIPRQFPVITIIVKQQYNGQGQDQDGCLDF